MAEKSIIIIGAGVAGLAAGCYAQMNGFRSRIFELHDLPGGLCTAWERKGYIFDGCLHYVFGSGDGQPFWQVWDELGAVQGRQFIDHKVLKRIVGPEGRELIAYADPDQLEQHMLVLSPADARHIKALADGVRQFTQFDMSLLQQQPRELLGATGWRDLGLKAMPFATLAARWAMVSAEEFAQRFDDPFLRQAIPHMFGWGSIPMMAGMYILAAMATGNAGFPAGGSLEFVRAIERRYLELGGELHYKSQVEKILVEDNQAVGVRLYNDDIHQADYVVSAADGRGTIFDLLGGQFLNRRIQRLYDGHLPILSQLQVSLGIQRDLTAESHWVKYLLPEPILIAGQEKQTFDVKNFSFDPSLAPEGKTAVVVAIESNYAYWQRIYGRRLYDTEQLQVADIVIEQLEQIYPGIGAQVEVKDVATPLSYERFTGNWLGSTCGWLLTDKTITMLIQGLPKTLPGLSNFYMAGQWVEPGGSVPVVAMSGRNAIQLICHEDARPFVTTRP